MKSILLALLLAPAALAADPAPLKPIELTCVTEIPTTSFVVWTEQDSVYVRVLHHNGSGYAPAISGIFTPNDIPVLAERAELVRKMKDDTTFRWPRANCKELAEMVLQCFSADRVEDGEGGAKIAPFAFYTSTMSELGIAGLQETHTVNLSFDVDGKTGASLGMSYPKGSCVPRRAFELHGQSLR